MRINLSANRNLGLDVIRGIAILLVLLSHGRMFFHNLNLQPLSFGGFYGVQIFFVLSGYLIGLILIKNHIESNQSIKGWLAFFYISRWFRTFPLYFILLAFLSILGANINWQYLLFLQNFSDAVLNKWAVTWSLTIEEWFYFCTPLLLIVSSRIVSKKHSYLLVVLSIILLELLARVLLWVYTKNHTMSEFRKTIYLQMDSLAVGMLLAYLNNYKIKIYNMLASTCVFLLGIFFVIFTLVIYAYYGYGDITYEKSFFCSTLYFDVAAFSVFLVIPFIKERFNVSNKLTRFLQYNALISYSLYLIHYKIFIYFDSHIKIYSAISEQVFMIVIAVIATYGFSILSFLFIEVPFLKLRAKLMFSINWLRNQS